MKKLYAFASLGIPLCLAAAWLGTQTTEEPQQQVPQMLPDYGLESHHFAMNDLGSLLQRMGREIQQNKQITLGGTSYPLSGFGGIEFHVSRRMRGEAASTGVQLDFGSDGRTTTPVNQRTGQPRPGYDPYQRTGNWWPASSVGDLLAEIGETLAGSGAIVLEHHRIPFRGTARIDQRLLENNNPKGGRGEPYELEVNVLFGEGEFEGPDDDSDYTEDQEYGLIKSLAREQREGADRAAVASLFSSLAQDLRAGHVRVGDEQLPAGDNVRFVLTNVTATDGSWDKLEFTLGFGPTPPRMQPGETRYGDEQFNEPVTDLAAILQRLGAQILEDGTFELGEQTFSAGTMATWEIYASPRGFAVEVSYMPPSER